MLDLTTRFLLEKYQPDNPLLQECEPAEVEKAAITVEELLFTVRAEMLSAWGFDPKDRHAFADNIVARAAIEKCSEYNVINLPEGGSK